MGKKGKKMYLVNPLDRDRTGQEVVIVGEMSMKEKEKMFKPALLNQKVYWVELPNGRQTWKFYRSLSISPST